MTEQPSVKWNHRLDQQARGFLGRFLLTHVMKPGTVVWYPRFNAKDDGQGVVIGRNFEEISLHVRDTGSGLPHYLDLGKNPFSLLKPPAPSFLERLRINFFRR